MEILLHPSINFGILSQRSTKEKKIIEVGLVSTINDSYKTVINPRGCITPLEGVPVDYNHNRISTGAKMFDKGYKEIEVPDGNGGTEKAEVRVVEIHVYKDSRMWTRENKDKRAEDVPSLYEAVENGRISWGSVDFEPIEENIERVYNSNGDLIREEYKKWRLNFFSLLDTKPGQDTSYIYSIRMKNNNILRINNSIMYKTLVEAITAKLNDLETDFEEITDIMQTHKSETEGLLEFKVDGSEYTASYTVDGETVTLDAFTVVENEEDPEPEDGGEEEDEDEDRKPVDGEEKRKGEEDENKRMGVSSVLKSKDGKLALVSKKVSEQTKEGTKNIYTLVDLDSKEEMTVDGTQVGYGWDEEGDREWTYAEMGDVVAKLFDLSTSSSSDEEEPPKEGEEEGREGDEEADMNRQDANEVDKLKTELKEERAKYRSLKEKFEKLQNSPIEEKQRSNDSATDLEGDEDSEDAEDKVEQARQALLSSNVTL